MTIAAVAAAPLSVLLLGCGDDDEPETDGGQPAPFGGDLPGSTWTEYTGWLAGAEGVPGDQLITVVLRLRVAGGTGAVQILSFRKRRAARPVRCGDRTYDGGARTEATGKAGDGWFGIDDQGGTAALSIVHAVEVAPALRAPPNCLEISGRWTGASGSLRGQSGTFEYASPPGKADAKTRFR